MRDWTLSLSPHRPLSLFFSLSLSLSPHLHPILSPSELLPRMCVATESAGLGGWDITFQSCVVEAQNGAMLALSFHPLSAILEGLFGILESCSPGRLEAAGRGCYRE